MATVTHRIKAPDGTVHQVNAPDTATPEELIAFVRQQQGRQQFMGAKVEQAKEEILGAPRAALIGAGRAADQVIAGTKQLGLNTKVAAKELTGLGNTNPDLRALSSLEEQQRGNDEAYRPLQEKYPFATGFGETVPMLAIPGGQATLPARLGVPALANAAIDASKHGSAEERGKRGATGAFTGLLGGAASEAIRSVIQPAQSTLTKAQQTAVQDAAQRLGIQPRPSELTGNKNMAMVEDYLANSLGSGGVMGELVDANRAKVSQAAVRSIGEQADAPTGEVLKRAADNIGSKYDTLKAGAVMPVTSDVMDAITKAEGMLTKGSTKGKEGALGMLTELKDALYQTKQLDGDTYQAWVRDLAAEQRGTQNSTIRAALKTVEREMDKSARGSNAAAWQQADQQYSNLKLLQKPGVVNEVTGQVYPGKLATQMQSRFGEAMKQGKIDGELADIAAYGRGMPEPRPGSPTAMRQSTGNPVDAAMAPARWALAKLMTSQAGSDYLSGGLLANPEISSLVGGLLGRATTPLTIAEIRQRLMLQ